MRLELPAARMMAAVEVDAFKGFAPYARKDASRTIRQVVDP